VRDLEGARYVVQSVRQREQKRNPAPPFITSTLQQEASRKLGFGNRKTMQIAQQLYEGIDLGGQGSVGLITYMRTDSTRVAAEAQAEARRYIEEKYGGGYLPPSPPQYRARGAAQDAHEAIRPTSVFRAPDSIARFLSPDQRRLYRLIWQRFVASQMTPAVYAVTTVEVLATPAEGDQKGLFKAAGSVLKFDGWLRVMPRGKSEEAELPPLKVDQAQDRLDLVASQHFTKPPPRYNEGSLIKKLEAEGIGRPSTYATIIGKITSPERGYIEVRERRFHATDIGKRVTDLLVEHFPDVMNLKFTSHFEEELDDIETGKMSYRAVLDEFWGPFKQALDKAEEAMPTQRGRETGEMCPKCGKPLVENFSKKTGRNFVGCSGWKEGCKYIKPAEGEEAKPEPVLTEFTCPNCGKFVERVTGRWGDYLRCTGYPECKTNLKIDAEGKPVQTAKPTEYSCEKCGKPMVLREGRRGPFLACTGYPKCKNAKDVDADGKPIEPKDLGLACEKCGSPMAVRKGPRGPFLGCTAYPKCRNYKALTKELRDQLNLPPPPAKKEAPQVEIRETCPDCGGAMKARQGRKGWFLGCAKYPKCKGVREAPPEVLDQLTAAGAAS
jgi:DNA topoisomerase-1